MVVVFRAEREKWGNGGKGSVMRDEQLVEGSEVEHLLFLLRTWVWLSEPAW